MRPSVISLLSLMFILVPAAAFAGDLDPNPNWGSPSDPSGAMFTIEDIYNRLNSGEPGTKRTGPFKEPDGIPAPSGHTLNDVMGKAPVRDNANGATAMNVTRGTTFWGLTAGQWGLQTGTAYPAPVPDTGDSAETAGIDFPVPRFIINDNGTPADQSDDTVTDNLTGLMWARDADKDGTKNWNDAKAYCNTLTIGPYTDWRLPTLREIQSLCHYGYFDPAVPNVEGSGKGPEEVALGGDPFNNLKSSSLSAYYWTSTIYAGDISYAWIVSLRNGSVSFGSDPRYVLPVRGGQ